MKLLTQDMRWFHVPGGGDTEGLILERRRNGGVKVLLPSGGCLYVDPGWTVVRTPTKIFAMPTTLFNDAFEGARCMKYVLIAQLLFHCDEPTEWQYKAAERAATVEGTTKELHQFYLNCTPVELHILRRLLN